MLLAVDIGNSNIKFGIFDSEQLLSKFSIQTHDELTTDSLKPLLGNDVSISNAIICSVVPDADASMREFLISVGVRQPLFVENDFDFGLKIDYDPITAIGTDRLVNSFASVEKYGAPCIVCSFGTATTIDVVNENRELFGGIIAPGMKTMAKALHFNTAQLPDVEIEKPESIIGNSTATSIQSGIFYGHIAMAEGLIVRMKKEYGNNTKVIATGGFAHIIAQNTSQIDFLDNDLTLDGLSKLYRRLIR